MAYRICPDYPKDDSATLNVPALESPVRVYLDDLGVPHIEAESEPDLVRAVGFLHARARFFEMDIVRRYACGRLSELVGEQQATFGSTVTLDTSMRSWGFDEITKAEADRLDGELKQLMSAYVEGVNAALEQFEPVEYRLLRVRPEPWTIADSFAVGHLIAWGITHNWQQEACRLLLALQVGHERAERILPSEPWPGQASLESEGQAVALPPSVVPELEAMFPARPYSEVELWMHVRQAATTIVPAGFEGASNGWVLGGERTRSGMPIIAGDPHLPHTLPSIVFQQHLRCPGLDVIGVTVPGVPYVMFGHNRQVAWTITAAMADVLDLYIERATGQSGQEVLGPGGAEPVETRTSVVRIRDGSVFREKTIRIRHTARGPLLNDMYPHLLPKGAPLVSVHGITAAAGPTILGLRRANGARSVREFREAMMNVVMPIGAVSAADTNGRIVLFATGSVPVRKYHRGTFPVPAWIERYRWAAWAPPQDIPHAFGSGRTFLVNTNNLMVDPARGPVMFHVDSAPSYRRDRVVQMIEATGNHTFESNARIQGDILLLRAKRLLPAILEDLQGMPSRTPMQEEAIKLLCEWDYRAEADSAACSIFFATYREAIIEALRDEVDQRSLTFLLSFRYFTNGVDLWFDDPNHPVWDDRSTAKLETRADAVRSAFLRAVRWLSVELAGDDPQAWSWGRLHFLHIQHALGSRVGSFNLERWMAPGASTSVWKAQVDLGNSKHPFRSMYGPVLRMIVDLADISHAWWVVDTGSSGWPHSPHYGDQYELWRSVEFAPMIADWDEIRKNAAGVLTLSGGKTRLLQSGPA
ncbi:MAG: penicillin acylase family protein [Phycisphaerales bacterium]|nr:MAG: penicillin acylase family protein [Phycisphaerales bacterium]